MSFAGRGKLSRYMYIYIPAMLEDGTLTFDETDLTLPPTFCLIPPSGIDVSQVRFEHPRHSVGKFRECRQYIICTCTYNPLPQASLDAS
jgi:hypothetical protein